MASSVEDLRKLGHCVLHVDLIGSREGEERIIGRYTFRHSAWNESEGVDS